MDNAKMTDNVKMIGSIRVHGKADEIHFHNDTEKKRCAMKTSTFRSAWNHHDRRFGLPLYLVGDNGKDDGGHSTVRISKDSSGDLAIEIEDSSLGTNFQKMEDFVDAVYAESFTRS